MASNIGLYNQLGRSAVKDFERSDIQESLNTLGGGKTESSSQSAKSFIDYLTDGVKEVNALQNNADAKSVEVASGKTENLHETMLAISEAELSFNFMVQVRNKALEAYNQIINMPV